jgi:pimeloyl-ACP methyl ester carboxylesterase
VPKIAYDRRGRGEPLLLIHPLGGDRRVWAPVMDRLAAARDTIAVDLPGFGESAPVDGNGDASPAAFTRAVEELIAGLGIDRPHVAGNSLGGWVALELARRGRVRSVTAIAPAGLWTRVLGPKPSVARRVAKAALPVLTPVLATPHGRAFALATVMRHPGRVPARDAVHLVRAYAQASGFDAANDAMRSGRFEGLAEIDVPVTLAWPDHDRLIARPAQLPAKIRNVVLRDCGHLPMWDDPGQVANVLIEGSSGAA